ncbi:MAG TPA: hypothetical protein VK666_00130 [Chryseolinea sp.]|nr:hypothetical protein [Chryseolinea sp.]
MEILTIVLTKVRMASVAGVVSLCASCCFAQDVKKVEMIMGEWTISNDITPIQARANAIDQAKAEALRIAGASEYVAESSLLYKSEKDNKLKDIHESVTSIDVSGEISGFQIVKEQKKLNEFGDLKYEVWINASVILHTGSKDPGFNVDVKGIRDSYRSPEELIFEVMPAKEGFLNIFILGDDESLLLYPNKLEKREKFEGGKPYKFPRSKALDYEVSTQESAEVNYLVLLYTKSEVPFLEEATSENILQFIARIDPAQKCIKSYSILIRQE